MVVKKMAVKNISSRKLFTKKMLNIFFMYISFLLFAVSCSSDNKPYFWKAEKNGKTSWLLGTHHEGISLNELLCSDNILEKLKNSDLVFTELGKLPQQINKWDKKFYSLNGMDFKQLRPKSQRFLEQKGVDKHLNYEALSMVMSYFCLEEAVGKVNARISMDQQVTIIATQSSIPLQPLDDPKLRKPLENIIKSHMTKEYIEDMISDFPFCSEFIKPFIATFKMGLPDFDEAKGLARWVKNRYTTTENSKLFLKNRNEKWFSKYKSARKNYDRIFIAAGNAHFTHAFNLIDMLRRDGFDVERMSCKNKSLFNKEK